MKREFLKIIEHFSERKAVNKKTKVSIFFICFTISLFTWFLIKMSQDYSTDIDFPVQYINPPKGQILTHKHDSIVNIKLTSRGFDLLNILFLKSREAIQIDLSGSNIRKNTTSVESHILTRNINAQILKQIKFTDRISGISPDTLRFDLERIISKKVAVISDFQYTTKAQHYLYGDIKIVPDTITISGPPSMIDTINFIRTSDKRFLNVDKTINTRIKLQKPNSNSKFTLSSDSIDLFIPIEKFTENVISMPIVIRNVDKGTIKLFPENVEVTYLIALKDYSNFQTDMLSLGIIFDQSKNRQTIEVFHQPSIIRITNIEPETLEYIIIK